jgi:hypothetical protein
VPAGLDHRIDIVARTRKHRFDRPVAAIAHPPVQTTPICLVFDERPVPDALHPATHGDMANSLVIHARSPASMTPAPYA